MDKKLFHTTATASFDAIKSRATAVRKKAIQNLDNYLVELETAFQKGRGKLYWAGDANDAFQNILKVISGTNITDITVVEGPLTKELNMSSRLDSKASFSISHGIKEIEGKVLVSGVAFLSCDVASALIPNSGTALHMSDREAPTILLVSIDQLLPTVADLHSVSQVLMLGKGLSRSEVVSLTSVSDLHVILVDNGRSSLLALSPQNELLEAAGPQLFTSPNNEGVSTIERLYYSYLGDSDPFDTCDAFCVDGYDKEQIALNIPIEEIIIAAREQKAEKTKSDGEVIWRTWKGAMLNRKLLNRSSFGPISLMKSFYRRGFDGQRSFPKVSKSSFCEQWVKQRPVTTTSRKLSDIPKGQLLVRKPAMDGLRDED